MLSQGITDFDALLERIVPVPNPADVLGYYKGEVDLDVAYCKKTRLFGNIILESTKGCSSRLGAVRY